ncbi:MAG: hypothetical protein AAFX80_16440, partial [Cyanobacteria bacterium J06639_18]
MAVSTPKKNKTKKESAVVESVDSQVVHASGDEQEKENSETIDGQSNVKDIPTPEQSAEVGGALNFAPDSKVQMKFIKLVTSTGSERSKSALNVDGEVYFRQIISAVVETEYHE